MKSVVLCVDEMSLSHPECLGLEGECLVAQAWLRTFSEAQEARSALLKAREVAEVWVVSNDEIEPINLASTLKRDRPDRAVFLVSGEVSGSLMSRAKLAGIDGVLTQAEFVERYARWKREDLRRAASGMRSVMQIDAEGKIAFSGSAKEFESGSAGLDDVSRSRSMGKHAGEVVVKPLGKHAAGSSSHSVFSESDVGGTGAKMDAPMFVQPRAKRVSPLAQDGESTPRQSVEPPVSALQAMGAAGSTALAKHAFLLPVISASGGSGKSAISAMTALLTHRAGLKTLLLDLDLQFGDMRETIGVEAAMSVDELLAAPVRIEQVVSTADAPALLCAPRSLELAEDVVARLPELLDLVCSRFDVVIANTGSFWTDEHVVLLERCSRALFVIDQRPSSLRACQRALDLCTRCGIAVSPLVFAVNKCSKQGLYTSIDVSCALHGAAAKELYWGGAQVEEMLASGRAGELASSRNAFVESLEMMLGELVPRMPQLESARPASRFSLWGMLTGRAREEQPCL